MKIGVMLDQIDLGAMALPEFQRGYVWTRTQVRGLMHSLYRRHPVGTLLIWKTQSETAAARGEGHIQPGFVSLLLDGQQRITSLYGLIRGKPPEFFEGAELAFTDLRFNLEDESFEFYAPVKMRDDPLWVDVTEVLRDGPGAVMAHLTQAHNDDPRLGDFLERLQRLRDIREIDLHVDEVTGEDKTVDVVVDIFNRVNSGGTKLSKGDLALAKICAQWPEARGEMHARLAKWREFGYEFSLDWLLRNVNAIVTGRAEFSALAEVNIESFREGLDRAERAIDKALSLITARLGLDHDRVLGARGALPLVSRLLSDRDFKLRDAAETNGLLFWYVHCSLWGRYAGSTETVLNRDLEAIRSSPEDPVPALIEVINGWRGDLTVRPNDFAGWSIGARFYPLLYLLTRVQHARDWGNGIELQEQLLGMHAALEIHHIFPKARLYDAGYDRSQVNALANFTFLTMETNREVSDADPAEYIPQYEERHPGSIASHWIPLDPELWRIDDYPAFLEKRRELLAEAANRFLASLRAEGPTLAPEPPEAEIIQRPAYAELDDTEAVAVLAVGEWVEAQGLARGERSYELVDESTREVEAQLDLAWPDGLQPGLTQPVALLLNEGPAVEEAAGRHGFRFFTAVEDLRAYIIAEILEGAEPAMAGPAG